MGKSEIWFFSSLHLVSRLRTPSSKRHRIRMGKMEPFWESAPLLNAILKGKKKSNGYFQSILGWPLGGSGFWVMSTKVTTVVKGTSVSGGESCRKNVHDRSVLGTHSNSPPIWMLLLIPWIKTHNKLLCSSLLETQEINYLATVAPELWPRWPDNRQRSHCFCYMFGNSTLSCPKWLQALKQYTSTSVCGSSNFLPSSVVERNIKLHGKGKELQQCRFLKKSDSQKLRVRKDPQG